jgi:hypothetical protein
VSDLTLLLEQVDTSRECASQITSAPEAIQLKRQRRQKRGRESVQKSKQEPEIRQTSFNGLSDIFAKFACVED